MPLINWNLMSHPMNWVILFLMVFIAAYAVHLIGANLPTLKPTPL
jgi:hypothetical protein